MKKDMIPVGPREYPGRRRSLSFARDQAGVSAIEFALVVPVMLLIFVGMAELVRALDNWRKVSVATRAISDLTSQGDSQNPVRSDLMNDILASARPILRPFDGRTAKIVVSAMGVSLINPALPPQVCSSVASGNATARGRGLALDLTVPTGMGLPGMRYILVEVTMPYTPMLGSAIIDLFGKNGGQVMLSASMPWPVRKGDTFAPSVYPEIILPNGVRC
ncbi:TadE/TadG family type IV pilus assembly protein [uncultured Methylobacterium sp.]|uniref:TadE/TadG family type IV pilus assembly protein n=1 Tax=uncultured Methylobacterium sp. TaxID=157278 RepID=UPI0035CA40A9